ncbi:hypothetical protein K443DRAFT_546986 [Laccaria amethystina LaAM-08-1]|uniref:Uncharacterized protein n=1 Tax=Laccaria amethystina LaAM-08-1 TaxID=1095629 RepID=A0A0C9XK98_9AGAR|nr:hypothetical protein K443DRAFT_546986 [Laccaria amethystina LaAM-08-1]
MDIRTDASRTKVSETRPSKTSDIIIVDFDYRPVLSDVYMSGETEDAETSAYLNAVNIDIYCVAETGTATESPVATTKGRSVDVSQTIWTSTVTGSGFRFGLILSSSDSISQRRGTVSAR